MIVDNKNKRKDMKEKTVKETVELQETRIVPFE